MTRGDGISLPDRAMIEATYLALLGRMPESDATVDHYLARSDNELLTTVTRSGEFKARQQRNPLYHYNSPFNCEQIILEHARHDLVARPGLCTNFTKPH